MRGIVFTGGAGPSTDMCRALAKKADLVIAADSGLIAAHNAGIRPKWIIGDMDSLEDPALLDSYTDEAVLRYPGDKDFSDTELALNKLWDSGCNEVWIAGGGGGRTDHLLAIYTLFERERFPNRWITAAEDIVCIDSGGETKQSTKGLVSVFPLGDGPWQAQSSGLKWPLDGLEWKRGDSFGLSNLAEQGGFFVKSIRGRFIIISTYGENDGSNN